jgi:hypothetical protein
MLFEQVVTNLLYHYRFRKRMQFVARYAMLCGNSIDRVVKWRSFGINTRDEQMNMIFSILLYVMEYSLREEDCTMDDIASFVDDINYEYYERPAGYEESKNLARFVIEEILGNSGVSMYFKAYDYEDKEYKNINIRYIDNKVVYQDGGVKRTSYYLTDEGYNMVLSTMEVENNLKLTINEMLFKLHLEKADYNKAVDDIKNIFNQLRKQSQKILEAALTIKRNALSYSVEDYRKIMEENINTVADTRAKFNMHREFIDEKIKEFEEKEMNADEFTDKEKDNLNNLKIIGHYLTGTLEEHQKILEQHFDLKKLYDYELENYADMTLVQRFPFRSDVYDVILKDAGLLKNTDKIFNPLFMNMPDKIFNPEKMLEFQKRLKKSDNTDDDMELDFDEEEFNREKELKRQERMRKYAQCITVILDKLLENKEISLELLNEKCTEEERKKIIPTAEIFREVIIEFLTEGDIDISELRKEQTEYLMDTSEGFILNEMLLGIMDNSAYRSIKKIYVYQIEDGQYIHFKHVRDEAGNYKNFKCSNIGFRYEER